MIPNNNRLKFKTANAIAAVLTGLLSLASFSSNGIENSVNSDDPTLILRFEHAIKRAQENDPWLVGNLHQQQAVESLSIASSTLPDPKVSIGIANLASDSLEFDQEPMSQFKVGITQMFPRGDSLNVKQRQLREQSEQYPFQRADRKAKVATTVGTLWLDAYYIQQSRFLTQKNRTLFKQLIDLTEANYASTRGKTKQQDVIRAQVELTRLDDRLVQLSQQKNRYQGQLVQWLSSYESTSSQIENDTINVNTMILDDELPNVSLIRDVNVFSEQWLKQQQLVKYFINHPAVVNLDKKLKASITGVTLAQQKYQPEWGVSASYAYRDDDPLGNDRSDFLSLGVTFDLPLFTENRQDNEVKAAISESEMVKTERILLLRKMMSSFASSKGRLQQLEQRRLLFKNKLIPQINEQIAASLAAYTHSDGDFSEVVKARILLLDAEIDLVKINVEKQKISLELNYLFTHGTGQGVEPFEQQSALQGDSKMEKYNAIK